MTLLSFQLSPGVDGPPPELDLSLRDLARYEFGQHKEVLHKARLAAYHDTDDERVRRAHEKLLLIFLKSDATTQARREVCLWLGNLGTELSLPVLKHLLTEEEFADVAQISLAALSERTSDTPAFTTSQRAFEEKVMASKEPLTLLSAAWLGNHDARSRHAFELARKGVAEKQAASWLAEHYSELTPQRQIIAMQILLETEAPQAANVIRSLAHQSMNEVQKAAIRNLGFLAHKQDVALLMDFYHHKDEEVAAAARQALLSLPLPMLKERLLQNLRSHDPIIQAKGIEFTNLSQASFATNELLTISQDVNNPNQIAATRSLGKAAPAEMLEQIIVLYIDSIGSTLAPSYKQALWDIARKQQDHEATQDLLQKHAVKAHDPIAQKTLTSISSRLDRLAIQKS